MMLNAGVLPLTHIDGTPINGVSGEFYNVLTVRITTGQELNLSLSTPPLTSKRGVLVCKATCKEAHWYGMRPPFLKDNGKQLDLTNSAVLINKSLTLVPWGLPRNVGDSFKAHFFFDSLPPTLDFLVHAHAVLGNVLIYSDITIRIAWFDIDVKIYF